MGQANDCQINLIWTNFVARKTILLTTDLLLAPSRCCLPVKHEEDMSMQNNRTTVAMLIKGEKTGGSSTSPPQKSIILILDILTFTVNTKAALSLFAFKALLSALVFPCQLVTLCSHIFSFAPSYSYPALNTSFRMFM